ncbi:MAG: hypothetical protein HXX15_00685 [Rhodopseudomonas sp.]|uniref:HEPN domain-containing protein n=1 Tax=Rhodopseudomonas sp. TaxID=1078 RepID=UPI0017DC76E3|nr:HEPN domain-containing protein [Rhodopseudomonas sp.]NVN84576.1 hypothetical protein [Rhodopseudomonas sp.]
MPYWFWRYIPCSGVKLEFEQFSVYPETGEPILNLRRRNPKQKIAIKKKHIQEDEFNVFRHVNDIDFEMELRSESGDGTFFLDPAHVFTFLLMIKTGGWVNAPAILTSSTLDDPDSEAPYIFCEPFHETVPTHFGEASLTIEDVSWIKERMNVGLRFTNKPAFQNAMQALTSFHCVPFSNTALLIAWSGLEALFKTDTEISFRLSLYISNYLRKGLERAYLFERLRKSYDVRSKIAHGSSTKVADASEHANFTRDILRECLEKCINTYEFPNPGSLIFGE